MICGGSSSCRAPAARSSVRGPSRVASRRSRPSDAGTAIRQSTTPTFTATTRSANTVSRKVINRMTRSASGALRRTPAKTVQLAHVPGHDEQDGRQCRERNVGCHRREENEHGDQCQHVHDAGKRTRAAVADVGCRARDGSRRGEATEERLTMLAIPCPTSSWFESWRVPACRRPHRRQQRFDRSQPTRS